MRRPQPRPTIIRVRKIPSGASQDGLLAQHAVRSPGIHDRSKPRTHPPVRNVVDQPASHPITLDPAGTHRNAVQGSRRFFAAKKGNEGGLDPVPDPVHAETGCGSSRSRLDTAWIVQIPSEVCRDVGGLSRSRLMAAALRFERLASARFRRIRPCRDSRGSALPVC
jgi:hypothetical protein